MSDIHIKPSKKGTFTAAASKHGKSVQAFASQVLAHKENYSPAMVKKANFAKNAAKWHGDGGLIERFGIEAVRKALEAKRTAKSYDGFTENTSYMTRAGYPGYAIPVQEYGDIRVPYSYPEETAPIQPVATVDGSLLRTLPRPYGNEVLPARDNTAVQRNYTASAEETPLTFEEKLAASKALGDNTSRMIQEKIAGLKSGEDLKAFQAELLKGGYYNIKTPKLPAKTKDEIIALQQKLIDKGYDLGKYGADGKIGKFTRDAWNKYVQENPDEALYDSIVDGKIGSETRAAARRYYQDTLKDIERVGTGNTQTKYQPVAEEGISERMYDNISKLQKLSNMAFTVLPAHYGAYVNKKQNERMGQQLGIEDYDSYLGDRIQATLDSLNNAIRLNDTTELARLRDNLKAQKAEIPTNLNNRRRLSTAEKQAVAAVLTSLNGDREMTYEDYLANLGILGKEEGAYLGSNPRHINAKGADVLLYNGRSGYDAMNAYEDRNNSYQHVTEREGTVPSIINAESRIYHEPMRGRLGAFSYYLDKQGNIHIKDNLEAPEKNIARGRNDDQQYNGARNFFPRASTGDIEDVITAAEYRRWLNKAKKQK